MPQTREHLDIVLLLGVPQGRIRTANARPSLSTVPHGAVRQEFVAQWFTKGSMAIVMAVSSPAAGRFRTATTALQLK